MNNQLYLFCAALFLSFCGIKNTSTDFSASPKNATELIEKVKSKNNHPQWLNLKGSANILQKNQNLTVKINIENRKDSIIWISASGPFGIEIIRAQLTPDSIYFLNRINKTFLKKPVVQLKTFLKSDFSFYDIQDLITANPKISKKEYDFELNKTGFHLGSDNFNYTITNNYRIQNTKINNNTNNLEFALEGYEMEDNFPRKLTLKVETEETFEATINYSKVEINTPQKILFEIPASYEEIK